MLKRIYLSLSLIVGLLFSANHLTATVPAGLNAALLGASCAPTTFDPAKAGTGITLSNANLTATGGGNSTRMVGSVAGVNTGKFYWELLVTTVGSTAFPGMALASFNFTASGVLGANVGSFAYDSLGRVWDATGVNIATYSTYTSGDRLMFALDVDGGKWWVGKNGTWQNSGNPGAGTGAVVSTGISGQTLYAGASDNATGMVQTANFGASTFTYTVPSGFKSGFCK